MILKGDCIFVMKAMKPNSVDAVVTDPPYGLGFMNKEWDNFKPEHINKNYKPTGKWVYKFDFKNGVKIRRKKPEWVSRDSRARVSGSYDFSLSGNQKFQEWMFKVSTEAYRVLKPGGSMLVMGGTRTSHRLACAIEDSGFIIKDTLMWIYGSGFPKAQDLGKMIDKRGGKKAQQYRQELREILEKRLLSEAQIAKHCGISQALVRFWRLGERTIQDREYRKIKELLNLKGNLKKAEREIIGKTEASYGYQKNRERWDKDHFLSNPATDLAKYWDGFKVGGIKPAYEPIIWAVKPPEGSYVDNVLKHGVGAVNVDECRISSKPNDPNRRNNCDKHEFKIVDFDGNIISGSFGGKRKRIHTKESHDIRYSKGRFPANVILSHHSECDGDCHPDCAVRILDEQSGVSKGGTRKQQIKKIRGHGVGENIVEGMTSAPVDYSDNGGASRFFYCAKASRGERNAGLEGMPKIYSSNAEDVPNPMRDFRPNILTANNHPTVKPIKLFEWLIKLVTREEQIILDPFIGSGTTTIAAHNTGRKCVGIDKEGEYLEIAKRRIDYWKSQPKQLALGE